MLCWTLQWSERSMGFQGSLWVPPWWGHRWWDLLWLERPMGFLESQWDQPWWGHQW